MQGALPAGCSACSTAGEDNPPCTSHPHVSFKPFHPPRPELTPHGRPLPRESCPPHSRKKLLWQLLGPCGSLAPATPTVLHLTFTSSTGVHTQTTLCNQFRGFRIFLRAREVDKGGRCWGLVPSFAHVQVTQSTLGL